MRQADTTPYGVHLAIRQSIQRNLHGRDKDTFGSVNLLEKNLAFNLAGHVNHSVFWPNMSPDWGDKPDGELEAAINEQFGSFDAFRGQFTASALGIQAQADRSWRGAALADDC